MRHHKLAILQYLHITWETGAQLAERTRPKSNVERAVLATALQARNEFQRLTGLLPIDVPLVALNTGRPRADVLAAIESRAEEWRA